jgi:nucleoside-diphosphate-sugar epimerase
MKNILVTGGTGFIGQHLVETLKKKGYKITLLVKDKENVAGVKTISGDITKKETLKIPKDIEAVLHLAALTNSDKTGREAYEIFNEINFKGVVNVAEACKNIKKFVFMSSVDALGIIHGRVIDEKTPSQAKAPYDVSKYKAEKYLLERFQKEKFPVVILRPTMVYGEGELVSQMKVNVAVFNMCKMVKKHIFPIAGSGKNMLPLVHVQNVVSACLLALESKKSGEIYTVSDEKSYSLNEVIKTIARIENAGYPGPHIPKFIMKIGASLFELLEKITKIKAPIKKSGIDYITQNRLFDISKAKNELNYKPINLEEGLTRTIKFYEEKGYL